MKIDKTHFELNGYLVLPNIVPKSTLIKLNKNADQMIKDFKKFPHSIMKLQFLDCFLIYLMHIQEPMVLIE